MNKLTWLYTTSHNETPVGTLLDTNKTFAKSIVYCRHFRQK